MRYQLSELAKQTGSRLEGDDCQIESIAEISSASLGDIAFVSNPKYVEYLSSTKASALIIKPEFLENCSVPALVTDNPRYGVSAWDIYRGGLLQSRNCDIKPVFLGSV